MNQRQKALEWWRSLSKQEQFETWEEYASDKFTFEMFSASSSSIERLFVKLEFKPE